MIKCTSFVFFCSQLPGDSNEWGFPRGREAVFQEGGKEYPKRESVFPEGGGENSKSEVEFPEGII